MSHQVGVGGSAPRTRLRLSRSQSTKVGILALAQVPAALTRFIGLPWTGSVTQYIAAVALLPFGIAWLVLDLRVLIPILRG